MRNNVQLTVKMINMLLLKMLTFPFFLCRLRTGKGSRGPRSMKRRETEGRGDMICVGRRLRYKYNEARGSRWALSLGS
jgi:hypothetical protein